MQVRTIKGKLYDRTSSVPRLLDDAASVTLPEIALLTETIKGIGVNGEIDMPTYGQVGAMEVEITNNNLSRDTVRTFRQQTQHLEHRWATQVLDPASGETKVVGKKAIMKLIPKSLNLGSIESNKAEEAPSKFECIYLKYVVGNDVLVEIDKLNDKFIIDGVDYSNAIRSVL